MVLAAWAHALRAFVDLSCLAADWTSGHSTLRSHARAYSAGRPGRGLLWPLFVVFLEKVVQLGVGSDALEGCRSSLLCDFFGSADESGPRGAVQP